MLLVISDSNGQSVHIIVSPDDIEGRVTDALLGHPIEGAVVSLKGANRTGTTDANGHYTLKHIPTGDYRITVYKDGYGRGPSGYSSPSRRIRLSAGQGLHDVNFQLEKESILSGRVLDNEGKPLSDIGVYLWGTSFRHGRRQYWAASSVRTNDLGEYRISGIGRGTWYLGASRRLQRVTSSFKGDNNLHLFTFYPNATSLPTAQPLFLNAGVETSGVDLVLPETTTYCVRAKALTPGEAPTSLHASLRVYEAGWRSSVVASVTTLDGRLDFCGLPSGTYELEASITKSDGNYTCLGKAAFIVQEEDLSIGDVVCQPGSKITGNVSLLNAGAKDALPEGLYIALEGYDRSYGYIGENTGGFVQKGGNFELPSLFPLFYWRVFIKGLPATYYIQNAKMGAQDPRREPVLAGADGLNVILAADGALIQGHVLDKDNQPVPDAIAVLAPEKLPPEGAPDLVRTETTDQEGWFELGNLAPGPYRLFAFPNLLIGEGENPDFLRRHWRNAVQLNLQPRGAQTITVILQTER